MSEQHAIEALNVSFTYPNGYVALHDLTFRAKKSEFVAMLASNGSGKTTLIKILMRLLKPTSGSVRLGGVELSQFKEAELYRRVGVVFQNPNDQLFAATVEEDVACGPRNLGMSEEQVQERVSKALESVGAQQLRHRAIHHLSFGEQKRVAIAGILAMQPSIMVLDEPTAGLDPAGEHNMLRLLSNLNRENGITIIMATHSVDMLPLFADRIYLLNRGRVLKEGPSEEVFCDQDLIHAASLRLPYVSRLLDELKRIDGVRIHSVPLTLREARRQLLELIPDELIFGEQTL